MDLLQVRDVLLEAAAQISRFDWFDDFVVAVAATVTAAAITAIVGFVASRVRRVEQSGHQPQLTIEIVRPDRTVLRVTGSDTVAVTKVVTVALGIDAVDIDPTGQARDGDIRRRSNQRNLNARPAPPKRVRRKKSLPAPGGASSPRHRNVRPRG